MLKNKINKILVILVATCGLILPVIAPSLVLADSTCNTIATNIGTGVGAATGDSTGAACTADTTGNGGSAVQTSIASLASTVVKLFSLIVGIISVIMIIFAGFRYITSGGDSGKVGNAKNTLVYAIIGLVIVALAQLIVHYVLNTAAGAGTGA